MQMISLRSSEVLCAIYFNVDLNLTLSKSMSVCLMLLIPILFLVRIKTFRFGR